MLIKSEVRKWNVYCKVHWKKKKKDTIRLDLFMVRLTPTGWLPLAWIIYQWAFNLWPTASTLATVKQNKARLMDIIFKNANVK